MAAGAMDRILVHSSDMLFHEHVCCCIVFAQRCWRANAAFFYQHGTATLPSNSLDLIVVFGLQLAVTALLGTGAAAYANFKSIEAVLELVHSEIRSAGVIMESIKVGLTQRIIELALGEQTLVKDKAQLRDTLILKGMLPENTEGTSAWNASVASHLSGQLDDDDQAMLDSIESRQRSMVAGFNAVDKENGNGNGSVTRGELELTFGRISDEEWYHFDEDGVSTSAALTYLTQIAVLVHNVTLNVWH